MKKSFALLVALLMAVIFAGCGNQSTGLPNPFHDCETMEQAQKLCGFALTLPEQLDTYTDRLIQASDEKMFQVILSGESERIIVRKAPGAEDISGDYNEYSENTTETVGEAKVTLRGADSLVHIAVWQQGEYTFAISSDAGLAREAMLQLVQGTK